MSTPILSWDGLESPKVRRRLLKSETQGYNLEAASTEEQGRQRPLPPTKANLLSALKMSFHMLKFAKVNHYHWHICYQ